MKNKQITMGGAGMALMLDCSVSCSNGATCDLTCAGDDTAQPIAENGQCDL